MPKQAKPVKARLEIQQEQPILIAGQPGRLRASVNLHNPGKERIRLRTLPLTSQVMSKTLSKMGLAEKTPDLRVRPGVIRPGHQGQVSVSLDLDPHTPPGEYRAEVNIDGQTQPVVINVLEKIALRIRPNVLVVENRANERATKKIAVQNMGNVPLTISEVGAIFLDDDLLVCRTLRDAAASVDDELRTLNEYLAQILLSAKHVAESSGILRVHNKDGEVVIRPGETRMLTLEIRVPPGLDKRGRFRGTTAIYTADLTFVLVPPSGPPVPQDKEPPAARSRRSTKADAGDES